jgi:hypothetical protein
VEFPVARVDRLGVFSLLGASLLSLLRVAFGWPNLASSRSCGLAGRVQEWTVSAGRVPLVAGRFPWRLRVHLPCWPSCLFL